MTCPCRQKSLDQYSGVYSDSIKCQNIETGRSFWEAQGNRPCSPIQAGYYAYRSKASTKAPAIARYPAFVGCTWKGPASWRAISSSPFRP